MKSKELAKRVKEIRLRKGMSQELLAEESGLSLRTIQRIENGETKPMGDTLKRLSNAFDVSPDELVDWTIKEDKGFLTLLNLSALTFIFFPILGILVPFILWTSKKDKLKDINKIGKELINFEITWTIVLFCIPFLLIILKKVGMIASVDFRGIIISFMGMYLFNCTFIIINTIKIKNEQEVMYYPKFTFLRN